MGNCKSTVSIKNENNKSQVITEDERQVSKNIVKKSLSNFLHTKMPECPKPWDRIYNVFKYLTFNDKYSTSYYGINDIFDIQSTFDDSENLKAVEILRTIIMKLKELIEDDCNIDKILKESSYLKPIIYSIVIFNFIIKKIIYDEMTVMNMFNIIFDSMQY